MVVRFTDFLGKSLSSSTPRNDLKICSRQTDTRIRTHADSYTDSSSLRALRDTRVIVRESDRLICRHFIQAYSFLKPQRINVIRIAHRWGTTNKGAKTTFVSWNALVGSEDRGRTRLPFTLGNFFEPFELIKPACSFKGGKIESATLFFAFEAKLCSPCVVRESVRT